MAVRQSALEDLVKTDSNGKQRMQTDDLLYKNLSYKIIGILFKIHTTLGCGFVERIYQKAIEVELNKENIFFEREKELKVSYEGNELGKFGWTC